MNYLKIYNNLICKGKSRAADSLGLYEKHHIIPKCMGGDDSSANLVELTPEEHYVAHQLLAKIHPLEDKLIFAAAMMRANRPTNKIYGWLRRKHRDVVSKAQTGTGNSQFGTRWIHSIDLKKSIKIKNIEPLPDGWFEGRKISFDIIIKTCKYCGEKFSDETLSVYCSRKCKQYDSSIAIATIDKNLEEMIIKFQQLNSITAVLSAYGLDGRQGNKYLSNILKDRGFSVLKRRNSK